MTRIAYLPVVAAVLLAASPAFAQSDPLDGPDLWTKLNTDCGTHNLDESKVDGCLARAQTLEQTHPSPELIVLEAKLEQRASQAFNPNAVDQGGSHHSGSTLTQGQPQAPIPPIQRNPADEPPPTQLAGHADDFPADRPAQLLQQQDPDADRDLKPLQEDAQMDDGEPPDVPNYYVSPPPNPSTSEDDSGPGH